MRIKNIPQQIILTLQCSLYTVLFFLFGCEYKVEIILIIELFIDHCLVKLQPVLVFSFFLSNLISKFESNNIHKITNISDLILISVRAI